MRCKHGFEREVVPCPVCDAGKTKEPSAWSNNTRRKCRAATHARRSRAVDHGLVGEARCSSCGFTKQLSEFYVSRTHPTGHQSRCKVCDNNKRTARLQQAKAYEPQSEVKRGT